MSEKELSLMRVVKGINKVTIKDVAELFRCYRTMREIKEVVNSDEVVILYDQHLRFSVGKTYHNYYSQVIIPHELMMRLANGIKRKDIFIHIVCKHVNMYLEQLLTISLLKKYTLVTTVEEYSVYSDEYVLNGDNESKEITGKQVYELCKKYGKDKENWKISIVGQGIMLSDVGSYRNKRARVTYFVRTLGKKEK